MQKRAEKVRSRCVKSAAFSEIFILIIATVAFAFVLSEASLVDAMPDAECVSQGGRCVFGGCRTDSETRLGACDRPGSSLELSCCSSARVSDEPWYSDPSMAQGGDSNPPAPSATQSGSGGAWSLLKSWFGIGGGQQAGGSQPGARGTNVTPQSATSNVTGGSSWGANLSWGGALGAVMEGATYATTVYGLVRTIAPIAGASDSMTNSLSAALAAGVGVGRIAAYFIGGGDSGSTSGVVGGLIVGVAVAIAVFVAMYRDVKQRTISFSCLPWEAPIGGDNCEKCNGDPFRPCSEYRCKSLGQACQLLNKDRPGREMCTWVNPHDVDSPTIAPYVDVLGPVSENLRYVTDTSIRPPALGVRIVRGNNECLKAFTPLKFGVNTNEPAQCKVDTNHSLKFDQMQYYFGGSNYYEYNHTETMRLPGPQSVNYSAIESPLLRNDGTMQLFVRCRDANGNENVDEYAIKFCVDPSPDTTPPLIEGASITSGNPVKFGTTNLSVEVYINEPAECKWSVESKAYEDMEMRMSCDTQLPRIVNAVPTFVCIANLTGLKNNVENKYYFRCKDQPGKVESERNVMVQSYEYILRGSQPLNIVRVAPNGTVSGSSASVSVELEVETDDGAEEGTALCMFSPSGVNGTYVSMFETNSFRHKQTLLLVSGTYTYFFRCIDLGGNSVDARTTFAVFSDLTAPKVSRVYKEEGTGLKIVTDEDAECAYSLTSCNFIFEEGLKLIYSNPSIMTNSYLEWTPNVVYYIKCKDLYGNEPNPNECSVIVKAVEGSSTA